MPESAKSIASVTMKAFTRERTMITPVSTPMRAATMSPRSAPSTIPTPRTW